MCNITSHIVGSINISLLIVIIVHYITLHYIGVVTRIAPKREKHYNMKEKLAVTVVVIHANNNKKKQIQVEQ
jgi:hypothetical protein